jgi:hypothetical protein
MADPGVVTAEGPGSDFDEDNAPIDIIWLWHLDKDK